VKTIGLLGGMSWESSIEYERIINQEVRRRLGGAHSAKLVTISYDFAEIEQLQVESRWDEAARLLSEGAHWLEAAGAGVILLCTNTMHRVADAVEASTAAQFVHIADATADAVTSAGITVVGLLGTRYTMEQDFYRARMERRRDLNVIVPSPADRELVHRVIYEELVQGVIHDRSRSALAEVVHRLRDKGAQGAIAGCTEIELLLPPDAIDIPYFPSTRIHALAGVDAALSVGARD